MVIFELKNGVFMKPQTKISFNQRCYEILQQVPKGKVTTYKAIAEALGSKAYQAVGNAMNQNPNPVIVPCHRVVTTKGNLGGYAFGCEKKRQLLEAEGVLIFENQIVDFESVCLKRLKPVKKLSSDL